MAAPVIWTAAWLGSRLITPRLIASGSAAAGRYLSAEMAGAVTATLNNFLVRNVIGGEVQHALRHLMRAGDLRLHGDTAEATNEVACAFRVNEDEVKKDLTDAREFIDNEANGQSIEEAANALAERIRDRVPVRTGSLKGSIGVRRDNRTGDIQVGYGINWRVRHAHLIEYGTRPHIITPRPFRRKREGGARMVLADTETNTIYGKRAKHPGQRGLHIIEQSLEGEQVRVVDTYKVAFNEKLRGKYGS